MSATALVWIPALDAECGETEDNIEGPYYKGGAPERTALNEPGMKGTPLTVSGRVLNTACRPLSYAVLDIWQCDADGVYDNKGYTLRGKIQADKEGRYELRTIVPSPYKVSDKRYRPAHIHLKVSAPGTPVLTTQLYFEGDKWNAVDSAYRKSLTINPRDGRNGSKVATFDFKLKLRG
ncbi:MAG: dioxygenase [Acidobacteria bacterium]|nr:dioxygenase [Acidobacteriota bacterium]